MNYSNIISELNTATSFDLYRLESAISLLLDDPKRIIEVKRLLRIGQIIEYFDGSANRSVSARVIKFLRTRLLVENIDDNRRWEIRYYAVNIHQVETKIIDSTKRKGLSKTEISIGDMVGFEDKEFAEQYGHVIRLNQKTVTMNVKGSEWRVSYGLLFKVHEQALDQLTSDSD